MVIVKAINSRIARVMLALLLVCLGLGVCACALARFAVSTLADTRYDIPFDALVQAADFFPTNAPLQARVAAQLVEVHWDNEADFAESAETAITYANRAIALNSQNFEYHLLAGHAYEAKGELEQARNALKRALELAPSHTSVHWQYGNLLLRENRLAEALPSLRKVASDTPERIPAIYQMVWQVSHGDLAMLQEIASSSAKGQRELAYFLVQQKRFPEAVSNYLAIDRDWLFASPENARTIDALLAEKQWESAHSLWQEVIARQSENGQAGLWNGSWELPHNKPWGQFDWQISPTKFAQIGVVKGDAHEGQSSLQVVYKKIDTVSLSDTVKQLCVVKPATRYRLSGFVKRDGLVTPDGPSWQVTSLEDNAVLGSSVLFGTGTSDWEPFSFDFSTTPQTRAIWLGLRQKPQYKYTDPSSGTVWFDELVLQALP